MKDALMYVGRHRSEVALLADDAQEALRLDLAAPDFAAAATECLQRLPQRPRLVVRQPLDFLNWP